MAVQHLDARSGIANFTTKPNAAQVRVDTDDNTLKYRDTAGNNRVVVAADLVGTLTAGANTNLKLNTTTDSKPVLINSRDYTQASGDSIGWQSKPSQTVTTTGAVYGTQVSPRLQDAIASGGLVGVQSAPILKGNTGNITGDVRAFEASIDLNNVASGRTISGTVSALYAYLQASNSTTYSGGAAVVHVPTEDTKKWDYLLLTASGVGFVNTTASLGAQIGQILVRINGTTRAIPYYATS